MIELVFTVDSEIYGNGRGSLQDLVLTPAEKLEAVFLEHGTRFVVFPDAAELEMIEARGEDPLFGAVKDQLRGFHKNGFEVGLHIHPWWYSGRSEKGDWTFDMGEYNLCALPPDRIAGLVGRALAYLRDCLDAPHYTPAAFRAGHLLFQPTRPLGRVLAEQGIRLDSSVYRGGLWRHHGQDYRRLPKRAALIPSPQPSPGGGISNVGWTKRSVPIIFGDTPRWARDVCPSCYCNSQCQGCGGGGAEDVGEVTVLGNQSSAHRNH